MIRFQCPGCQATYTVGDEKAGKQGKCPKCQSAFVIPGAEMSAPPPPAPPPPPPPAEEEGIEIAPCPKCGTRLTVSPGDIGLNVQCPSCATTFPAARPGAVAPVPPPSSYSGDDDDRPARRRRRDDDDDDRPSRRSRRIGTVEIKRLGVLSVAKIQGALGFAMGAVVGFVYGGFFLLMAAGGAGGGAGAGGAGAMAGMGICFAIALPVFYGFLGFISGLIGALVYNAVASATGGIEMDLE